jgi:hypothetical protein
MSEMLSSSYRPTILVLAAAVLLAGCASGQADSALDRADDGRHGGGDAHKRTTPVVNATAPVVSAPTPAVVAYGEEIVEARLGPHVLRIPRKYFRYQLDPGSDQRFELAIRLPDAEPVPRGQESNDLAGAAISEVVVIYRADTTPPQLFSEWLGQATGESTPDPFAGDKPRVRGEPVWGLTPFYLDFESLRKQVEARGQKADTVASPYRVYNLDRYLAYGANGAVSALIECTSKSLDDGVEAVDGVLRRSRTGNTDTLAECDHGFVIAEIDATVNIHYPRAYLPDWRRIEVVVRDLISNDRVKK